MSNTLKLKAYVSIMGVFSIKNLKNNKKQKVIFWILIIRLNF